jgi:hypothetical protein
VNLVRYAALVALAIWLGGAAFLLMNPSAGVPIHQFHLTGAVCGVVIVVSMFFMKFIGPPPAAFTVRTAIAAAMTVVAAGANELSQDAQSILAFNAALGLVLLLWYARE